MSDAYYWSPTAKVFFAGALKARYLQSGSWPEDAALVSSECWEEFGINAPPAGFERSSGPDGKPTWQALPEVQFVDSFKEKLRLARAHATRHVYDSYSVFNEPTPDDWINYIRALDALIARTDLDPKDLPALPVEPQR